MVDAPMRGMPVRGFPIASALILCGIVITVVSFWARCPTAGSAVMSQASALPSASVPSATAAENAPLEVAQVFPLTTAGPDMPPKASQPTVEVAQILGRWKDEFYGERTFTFRNDGTGTMHIRLDAISRLLYGDEVSFEFAWTLDGDEMHFSMIGGKPEKTAETLSQLFGKTSDKRIEKLDDREMHLRSLDSQKLYIHRRN